MSDALSFAEIDGQHVELLPARTVLSMVSTPAGPKGGDAGNGGQGGTGGRPAPAASAARAPARPRSLATGSTSRTATCTTRRPVVKAAPVARLAPQPMVALPLVVLARPGAESGNFVFQRSASSLGLGFRR